MKNKILSTFVLICVGMSLTAQPIIEKFVEKPERRVYYLDVTASMTGYNNSQNIWNTVVTNLKHAINAINNPNTEIVIKTFTDANHNIETIVAEKTTPEGKKRIVTCIDKLDPSQNKNVHTDIYVPIEDFYKHEISRMKVNYFFLMTDGIQHQNGTDILYNTINKWNNITHNGEDHIYGFYVMLSNAAHSQNLCNHINQQKNLWTVESADVNINLIRPKEQNFICNIRQDDSQRYIDIPMTGELTGLRVIGGNEYCKVDKTKIIKSDNANALRVYLKLNKKLTQIPQVSTLDLHISQPTTPYSYLLDDQITIHCDNLTPWAKIGISIGIFLLLLLLIWFFFIKPVKYRTYKAFSKQILIKQNGTIMRQKRVKFTGAKMVIFTNKQVRQSLVSRIFTGKILTWVSPEFTQPITFKPTRNRKDSYMSGVGYMVTPNPIPRNGVATIANKQLNMEIILN